MRYFLLTSVAVALSFVSPNQSLAGTPLPQARSIGAPPGFAGACARYGWVCRNGGGKELDDASAMTLITRINRSVNAATRPAADTVTAGKSEYWSLPIGNRGDCEDYALLKMKTLLDAGFPSQKLALSVVIERRGQNHVVLVARLKAGDYVLDSLNGSVKPWQNTGYTFLATQSFTSKSSWRVSLAGPRASEFSGI